MIHFAAIQSDAAPSNPVVRGEDADGLGKNNIMTQCTYTMLTRRCRIGLGALTPLNVEVALSLYPFSQRYSGAWKEVDEIKG